MRYHSNTQHKSIVKEPGEQIPLGLEPTAVSVSQITAPTGYRGLAAFHKYWGKKPMECLGFLIERLTSKGDLVVDPFLGSGLIARECAARGRRFIGVDINPFAVELASLLSDLPDIEEYSDALASMNQLVRPAIYDSYRLQDGRIATHYLWSSSTLKEIWITPGGPRRREVLSSSNYDIINKRRYDGYSSRHIRPLQFFQNSRINTSPSLGLSDLFTGRALRNIDILLDHISKRSGKLRRALLLTLTASVGQMSNMVFAITGRGKTKGTVSEKVEVGSWVIGYWRPPLHFEINAWNCFQRRARKLLKAMNDLQENPSFHPVSSISHVFLRHSALALVQADAIQAFKEIPDARVKLVLTDPPHGDRIPYLELSELWNAVLGLESDFNCEIVISNARERRKTERQYTKQMDILLQEIERTLAINGVLAVLFNARDANSWNSLAAVDNHPSLLFMGCFPMAYSAGSVVQDNRRGSMKSDYVLIYVKEPHDGPPTTLHPEIQTIPGWSPSFPVKQGK